MFTLPALKSKYKEKLTAVHGVKVRKVAPIKVRRDEQSLNFLGCMLNDGSVCVFSLPALYRQFSDKLVEPDNKIATLYTEFTNDGSAYVLEQTNLVKHYALAKDSHPKPICVALPEGCRHVAVPAEPEPESVPEPVEEAPADEVDETVEAEDAATVESAPPPAESAEETKGEEGPAEDLPTVEEEAKKMIDDAEESKDAEFQERIKNQLSSDNPVITETTVTTYRAIESRTTITSDDGVECHKIITTTRNTTLSLDGDVVTQKTQQKEEFEISPSEEQEPTEVGQAEEPEPTEEGAQEEGAPSEDVVEVQTTTYVESVPAGSLTEEPAGDVTHEEEKPVEQTPDEEPVDPENKSGYVTSDDEILHADSVQIESEPTPVRTATITQNEDDQITHHIESEETEAPAVEEDSADPPEEAAPIEEPAEPSEEAASAEEPAEPSEEAAPTEEPAEPSEEAASAEEPAVASEETAEEKAEEQAAEVNEHAPPAEETQQPTEAENEEPNEDEAPTEDGISGECYGGSQGKLYSPMSRENEEVAAPVDDEANGEAEPKATESEEVNDAGDVPLEQNGHEEPENGEAENHHDEDAVPNGDAAVSEGAEDAASENQPESDDIEAKKAALASEESPATESTPDEALTADE